MTDVSGLQLRRKTTKLRLLPRHAPQHHWLIFSAVRAFVGQPQSDKKASSKLFQVPTYLDKPREQIKQVTRINLNILYWSRQRRADPYRARLSRQFSRTETSPFPHLIRRQQHCVTMHLTATKPPYHKLVSLRRVARVKKLDSSQTHEVVMIDGWPVVVQKGQFAANQKVFYFAIDCVLPLEDKRYEPYRFSQFLVELNGQKGWTVQTVKHEDHISQGMVFAMDGLFPEISLARKELEQSYLVDDVEKELMRLDLKKYLKIRKWSTFCEYINT